jgi:ankyrin repeat protein
VQDEAGNTLLHTAVSGAADQPDYVSSLLEAGVPVNAANKEHDAALHLAARQGHVEVGLGLNLID